MYLYCASERSERAPQKHIFSVLKIHLHTMSYTINAVSFNHLWYGAIHTTYWQDTKIKRNLWICERAERASLIFLTFSQFKTVISFIIFLVLQILSLRNIFSGLKIHLHTMSYTINAVSFNYLWYGAIYTRHTDKTLKLREIYEYASEQSERA